MGCNCDTIGIKPNVTYDYDPSGKDYWSRKSNHRVEISLGGVLLYTHPLSNGCYDDRDEERAIEDALEAFGLKLQALLSAFE